jgi:hypothetical protein
MTSIVLKMIKEIDRLWEPVYPYLTMQIQDIYKGQGGNILEIGPFCGVIFHLQRQAIGSSFLIATFPQGMGGFFQEEATRLKLEDKVNIMETDSYLSGIKENTIDLAIFRGALFFPSLFHVEFSAIYRALKVNGVALIGGGFGRFTPPEVIQDIGERSRDLNLRIGKVEIGTDTIWQFIKASNVRGNFEVISKGGLWVKMEK